MKTNSSFLARFFQWSALPSTFFQSLLLLLVRLYWGWGFFSAGKGKLMDLQKPTEFFQSLGLPFPHQQAMLVGTVECLGGLLLILGLCSRLISVPLTVVMCVAYATADSDKLKVIFSDSDKFFAADEFLFLFAVLLVLIFGPGKIAIDWLLKRKFSSSLERPDAP